MPKFTHNFPYTSRPFLRKQESLSHGRHRRLNLRRRWRHMVVRFLPTQEWSAGGRECIGEYGIVAVRRLIPVVFCSTPTTEICHSGEIGDLFRLYSRRFVGNNRFRRQSRPQMF